MTNEVDVNVVVNNLLDQIAAQAREIAMLKVQIAASQQVLVEPESDGGE